MKQLREGFTLIELIVVVSTILLFSSFALGMYNDFNETKKLEGETKKFVEVLELAKKKTLAGDKPCPTYTGSYIVSWTNVSYRLIPDGCTDQLTYNLIGLSLLTISSVTFKPFGLGIYLGVDGSGNDVLVKTVVIKNNNNSKCREVSIKNSGAINEQKINCP